MVTRWDSIFLMINRLKKHRLAVDVYLVQHKADLLLTASE